MMMLSPHAACNAFIKSLLAADCAAFSDSVIRAHAEAEALQSAIEDAESLLKVGKNHDGTNASEGRIWPDLGKLVIEEEAVAAAEKKLKEKNTDIRIDLGLCAHALERLEKPNEQSTVQQVTDRATLSEKLGSVTRAVIDILDERKKLLKPYEDLCFSNADGFQGTWTSEKHNNAQRIRKAHSETNQLSEYCGQQLGGVNSLVARLREGAAGKYPA